MSFAGLRAAVRLIDRGEQWAAFYKPPGMLMHHSDWAGHDGSPVLLQTARDLIGAHLYPVHRLDRPTSGLVLFALDPQAARELQAQFERHSVEKVYLACVRGWTAEEGLIDHPVGNPDDHRGRQEARTRWRRLATSELPMPVGRYASARYSLVEAMPLTGRLRQIRQHFHHISHPLLGDTSHGDGRHNQALREHLHIHRLLLHARALSLILPGAQQAQTLRCEPDASFSDALNALQLTLPA